MGIAFLNDLIKELKFQEEYKVLHPNGMGGLEPLVLYLSRVYVLGLISLGLWIGAFPHIISDFTLLALNIIILLIFTSLYIIYINSIERIFESYLDKSINSTLARIEKERENLRNTINTKTTINITNLYSLIIEQTALLELIAVKFKSKERIWATNILKVIPTLTPILGRMILETLIKYIFI